MVARGRGVFCNGLKINLIRKNSPSKTEDEVSIKSRIINHLQNTRQGGIRRQMMRESTAAGAHTGTADDEREQAGRIHTGTADGEGDHSGGVTFRGGGW